jgi:hypothetical protein
MLHYGITLIIFEMGKQQQVRTVFLYKNYFSDFFHKQQQKVKDKIYWTLKLIATVRQVPGEYLKHMKVQRDFMRLESAAGMIFSGSFVFLMMVN